jgi:hypothetical protein
MNHIDWEKYHVDFHNDGDGNFILSKYMDVSKLKKPKIFATNRRMKTILSRYQLADLSKHPHLHTKANSTKITSDYAEKLFKASRDLVEWNKFQLKKMEENGEVKYEDFEFRDRDLYKIYVELCNIRDSIPAISEKKIEQLKKNDRVFSKRYNQLNYARVANKAPKFDNRDNEIPTYVPKMLLKRKQDEIITKNISKIPAPACKKELQLVRRKTKAFLLNLPTDFA